MDPDPHWFWSAGSGSAVTHKNLEKWRNFMFWSIGCFLLRAEGLEVLHIGLGIKKIACFDQLIFSSCTFTFLVIKTRDPDHIGLKWMGQDPDPDSHWNKRGPIHATKIKLLIQTSNKPVLCNQIKRPFMGIGNKRLFRLSQRSEWSGLGSGSGFTTPIRILKTDGYGTWARSISSNVSMTASSRWLWISSRRLRADSLHCSSTALHLYIYRYRS